MFILEAIAAFGNWFWGLPILFLIVGGGICITIRLGFVQFRKVRIYMFADFRQDVLKAQRKAKYLRFLRSLRSSCLIHRSLNIVGVPAAE